MKVPDETIPDDSQTVAFNAILTVPDSDPASVSEFLSYINDNELSPIARMNGYPVYRLNDYQSNSRCYMSNERAIVPTDEFSAVEFSTLDSYLVFTGTSSLHGTPRDSYLVSQEIINVAIEQLGRQKFTPAELRLAAQILSGMQLKSAASADDVSLETKRSQMKSVIAKLEVNRQQDVMRLLLPELVRITDPNSWDREGQRVFNRYARDYLPDDVRCHRLSDREGQSVRIIDYGPLRGKPVLMLHSMIFPDITPEDVQFAHKHDLRLIWPLRPGMLETGPSPKAVEQYSEETLQGIDLAWEHMCGEPVHVIAMVSSAWHAVSFAKANPAKVSSISFAATCFSAGKYENNLVYFGSSVAELCSRNVWLMTKTVDFIRNNVNDIERFKTTIFRVFKNSQPDVDILIREFNSPDKGTRLMMAMLDSPESVKHDYFNQVHFHWESIADLKIPVCFYHGALDSVHKLKDVRNLIKGIGDIPLSVFETTGHIMQYEHFHKLLSESLLLNAHLETG